MNLPRKDPFRRQTRAAVSDRLPSRGIYGEKQVEEVAEDAVTLASIGAAAVGHEHAPLDNLAAAAAPGVTNDEVEGYGAGSEWVDLVNDKAYICLDATEGAAVWTETTQAGGGGGGGTLDTAYDFGGGGAGRIVTVDAGAVELRHTSNLTMLATRDPGDAADRFALSRDGNMSWGSGAGAADIVLSRAAVNRLAFAAGDILGVQYLADTAGNTRITTSNAPPHVAISDDFQVAGVMGLKGSAISQLMMLRISPTMTVANPSWSGIDIQPTLSMSAANRTAYGVLGVPSVRPTGSFAGLNLYGLYFAGTCTDMGMAASTASFTEITAIYATVSVVGIFAGNTITVATLRGLHLKLLVTVAAATVSIVNAKGIHIVPPGSAAVGNFWGIHLEDETAATGTNYLLEIGDRIIGPVTPYLRLLGGGNPAANQTNLYLKEAANLRQVRWMDPGAGGANFAGGERVMVLV